LNLTDFWNTPTTKLEILNNATTQSLLNKDTNKQSPLSDGVISAIAFGILLVLGIVVVTILILMVFGRHKKEKIPSTKQVLGKALIAVFLFL